MPNPAVAARRARAPRTVRALAALALAGTLVGCVAQRGAGAPADGSASGAPADASAGARAGALDAGARWALLPVEAADANAGRRAAALIETHLRARGVDDLERLGGDPASAPERARRGGHRYAVRAAIDEWGHGGRLGGAPRVGLGLEVVDLRGDRVAWRGEVDRDGRVGTALAELAERAVGAVVGELALAPAERVDSGSVAGARAALAAVARSEPALARADAGTAAGGSAARAPVRSIAFHYGAALPVEELAMFDRVVVEPDHTDAGELAGLARHGARVYAYLSVGEVGPTRAYGARVDPSWTLGTNAAWNSRVMDATDPGWTALLHGRVDELAAAGYDGLFLDTLDSHRLYARTPAARAAQEDGLVAFLESASARHPTLSLIANRGFEILDRTAPLLEAVAGESLYASWNAAAEEYVDVLPADRAWLSARLAEARDRHGLEAIAIDYLPPERRDAAREVARRIAADGFTPWVTTPALDHLGVGAIEVLPREVLMLFDGRVNGAQEWSEVHKLAATPIEYLGYVPRYHDVALDGLPSGRLAGTTAGIVIWGGGRYPVEGLTDWLAGHVAEGVPIALVGGPVSAIDRRLASLLGIETNTGLDPATADVAASDDLVGFERDPPRRLETLGFDLESVSDDNAVHLAYEDARGRRADAVITGPWGGIAGHPGAVTIEIDDFYRWVVDPFEFFARALKLEPIPAPDVTTENGRRLWLAHIDGDALPSWAEVPGGRLGAEEIEARILARWPWPHTVSVVEGEMTAMPGVADRRGRMYAAARRLFRLPHVEIASHSFSHPFDWQALAAEPDLEGESLPVPGYAYDPEREIGGSVDFIESRLAPPGKRVGVFLWTGDALPDEAALAAAERRGLANLNGGLTSPTLERPTLALVDPMARTVGDHLQVYAPMTNENVFTDEWRGPFDAFRHVIETFELTDRPRRLKPINVYYHFYAGTKAASLRSLEEVYAWSTAEDVHPVHVAEYAAKVAGFREARVARSLDGRWTVAGLGDVRSLRLLGEGRRADLATDAGLVGQRELHDGTYLHTAGADRVSFDERRAGGPGAAPSAPRLVAANGRVTRWDDSGGALRLRVRGHVPIELELAGVGGCSIVVDTPYGAPPSGEPVPGEPVPGEPVPRESVRAGTDDPDTFAFRFDDGDTGDVRLDCPA